MSARRVAIVKSAGRADAYAQAVRAMGAVPVLVSPFREERIDEGGRAFAERLRAAGPDAPRWVAVTSPSACWVLTDRPSWPGGVRVAAVGPGTASAVQSAGVRVDLVGDAGGRALARRMLDAGLAKGDVVLFPCGEDRRPEMTDALAAEGAAVVAIPVYRMVEDAVGARAVTGTFAAVVVGSPRLAERAAALFPGPRPPVVAIGRTTAAALRDLGWPPAAVAAAPTPEDVAAALRAVLADRERQ